MVGTAEDEPTAVRWLAAANDDATWSIVDIFLKSGSGLGVLRPPRTLRQPTKLVVLSNYATPDMRRKCLELGADRVFDKSNEIDALILYCVPAWPTATTGRTARCASCPDAARAYWIRPFFSA